MQNTGIFKTHSNLTMTRGTDTLKYYAFGSAMSSRVIGNYRYGFNTQEKDDEVAGEGNSYTAEFWQYDSRLGRRFNVDPVIKYYESSYACFGNNPIWFCDIDGKDTIKVTSSNFDSKGNSAKIKNKDGNEIDNPNFDKNNPLVLFTAYSSEKTGENNTENVIQVDYSNFKEKYQTISPDISMSINNSNIVIKKYAKFLSANSNLELLKKAVFVTNLLEIGSKMDESDKYAGGTNLICQECVLNRYWGHGDIMDYKSQVANGMKLTYIEGIGIFESDFVGNLIYGWAWGGYDHSLSTFLGYGDFLSDDMKFKTGKGIVLDIDKVDDVYDGYAIALGSIMRELYSTSGVGLKNFNNIILDFNKKTNHSKTFYGDDSSNNEYNITYKVNGKKKKKTQFQIIFSTSVVLNLF
jgi:hypothetical protein